MSRKGPRTPFPPEVPLCPAEAPFDAPACPPEMPVGFLVPLAPADRRTVQSSPASCVEGSFTAKPSLSEGQGISPGSMVFFFYCQRCRRKFEGDPMTNPRFCGLCAETVNDRT